MSFLQALFRGGKRERERSLEESAGDPVSEERFLAEEIALLDRNEPGWDEASKLAGATSALRAGLSPALVSSVYGERIAAQALEKESSGDVRAARSSAWVSSQGKTVLVIDDSAEMRGLVARVMQSRGLRIVQAADVEQALGRMDAGVDLVVTDVEMPAIDGVALVRALRERHARRVPVLVVSRMGSEEEKRRALDAGADAYVVKNDFSHTDLMSSTLARLLA